MHISCINQRHKINAKKNPATEKTCCSYFHVPPFARATGTSLLQFAQKRGPEELYTKVMNWTYVFKFLVSGWNFWNVLAWISRQLDSCSTSQKFICCQWCRRRPFWCLKGYIYTSEWPLILTWTGSSHEIDDAMCNFGDK